MRKFWARALNEYGMLLVLLLLCAYYASVTVRPSATDGRAGGESCAEQAIATMPHATHAVVIAGTAGDAGDFADAVKSQLGAHGVKTVEVLRGGPPEVRAGLEAIAKSADKPQLLVTTMQDASMVAGLQKNISELAPLPMVSPRVSSWPVFLTTQNWLNIGDQISVIAITAVGMTLVILTAGIDLSVGSLAAMAAVIVSILIRDHGGVSASTGTMIGCSAAAVLICGVVGLISGAMIAWFNVPPFIVTLAMMQIASGLAFEWSHQQSIHEMPESFTWLGKGASLFGLPNTLVLMIVLYVLAHLLLSRMRMGRYIYAVGGNAEAARLSGINISAVLLVVYFISGLCAGVGGLIFTSELRTGSATYGVGLELSAIAAVVLGGTSLMGGEGNVLGTLIGAFLIAVLHNGMDLTGVPDARQRTILGLVILGGVFLDQLKHRSWKLPKWLKSPAASSSPVARLPAEKALTTEEAV